MKKLFMFLTMAAVVALMTSCGGGSSSSSKKVEVTFDALDDYFSVKSVTLESDAAEKGIENIDKISGTLTIVVKRNNEELKYKPSDIVDADFEGGKLTCDYVIIEGSGVAAVKKMLKMEVDTEETFTLSFKGNDPKSRWESDEVNEANRQIAYKVLTNKEQLDLVRFDIEIKTKGNIDPLVNSLKALKELADEMDDDY